METVKITIDWLKSNKYTGFCDMEFYLKVHDPINKLSYPIHHYAINNNPSYRYIYLKDYFKYEYKLFRLI